LLGEIVAAVLRPYQVLGAFWCCWFLRSQCTLARKYR